jgi:Ni/Co efflux regulator RcnB
MLAPVAQADRDRRDSRDRGGWERYGDGDYGDGYRHRSHDYDRGHDRHERRDYRDHPRGRVVVYRPYHPRSSVTVTYGHSYGPYSYSSYRPRYDIGHSYIYGPRRTVYISDYHNYGLYAPPPGYHWVRDHDRGDAILASVATGAIIGLVIGAIASD